MRIGYHTKGMSHHELFQGLMLLAETGYQSVAICIDHGWLSPGDALAGSNVQKVRAFLAEREMKVVVEGTANYLLSSKKPCFPTLMEHDPDEVESRMRYLKYCIDVAAELDADCMSFRSGLKPDGLTFEQAMTRLVDAIGELLLYAAERDVIVSIEPEPEMLVDTLGRFDRLLHLFDSPRLLLTLDASHLFCNGELPVAAQLDRWKKRIANMHISDVRSGSVRHLPFKEGEINFPLVLDAIASTGYENGIHVDLPRHSHNAAGQIQQSYDYLFPLIQSAKAKNLER